MYYTFNDFLKNHLIEDLHPELQKAFKDSDSVANNKKSIVNTIKKLVNNGEETGLEGNTPQGSSRMYLPHKDPHPITIDGKQTTIKVGTKVVKPAMLDKFHFGEESLGSMQNRVENGDSYNDHHRVLTKDDKGDYHTNNNGIFPPLIDHDETNHEWSTIGHSRDLKAGEFNKLTKTKEFPKGITHKDFTDALIHRHESLLGKRWKDPDNDAKIERIQKHPLVQNFMDFHDNTGHPPYDYLQKKNMGVFEHPDGHSQIVARDHGFSTEVADAYQKAHLARARKLVPYTPIKRR